MANRLHAFVLAFLPLITACLPCCGSGGEAGFDKVQSALTIEEGTLYTYVINEAATPSATYDNVITAASAQGLLNRNEPRVYVFAPSSTVPRIWLKEFSIGDGWLAGRKQVEVKSLTNLVGLAANKAQGIVIWDPEVPASLNVATTYAGAKDCLVMTRDQAKVFAEPYGLKTVMDFTGMFTGAETGSAKNDAYRWAIREILDKGLCSPAHICLFEDSYLTRAKGDIAYAVTRDWAVRGKYFCYDLSPWNDEAPADDPGQPLGLDKQTYEMILSSVMKQNEGKAFCECDGFFSFPKYSASGGFDSLHQPTETEWENVNLISRYNCFQNTVAHECYNQSLHCQAPRKAMKQGRPALEGSPTAGKTYISIFMADYDSTTPLYDFLLSRDIWNDPRRGELPLLWGINPNLGDIYPDIMQWLYESRTPNDWFAADASCAGYFNPSVLPKESLQLFAEHNKKYYDQWDMSISPMVLDVEAPDDAVKDAFMQFSPDGYATIVASGPVEKPISPGVWKGMPMIRLRNEVFNACDIPDPAEIARRMSAVIPSDKSAEAQFFIFRMVWTKPSMACDAVYSLKQQRPDLDIEVLDAYNFFDYIRRWYGR